jgi:hypothetical protein
MSNAIDDEHLEIDDSPEDAADEELSCWGGD